MSISTNCQDCIFAQPVESGNKPCSLGIPDLVQDSKPISIRNNYYYIDDYVCRFAFSKKIYEEHKEELNTVDMVQLLSDRSGIKYYLILKIKNEDNIEELCDTINKLTVKPVYLSFALCEYSHTKALIKTLENKLDKNIKWKIHNFIEVNHESLLISNILDTNKKANNSHYFIFFNSEEAGNLEQYIMRINTIVNIEQKSFSILAKKQGEINGVFVPFENYVFLRPYLESEYFSEIFNNTNCKVEYYV
jgi:hypothetical protein